MRSNTKTDEVDKFMAPPAKETTSLFQEMRTSLLNILSVFKMAKFYLVVMLPFYYGAHFTFVHSEMTRAFASCIFGLRFVSLAMMIYTSSVAFSSFTFGIIASHKGVSIPFSLGFSIDMTLYTACLCINPNNITLNVILLIFGGFGVTAGIWSTLVVEVIRTKLPKDVSSVVWALLFNLGCAAMTSISLLLCVVYKIYLMAGILFLSMVLYAIDVVLLK